MIATEIPRLSYLTKLNKPAPLSVGLPMPAACCTTLTDVINVHPMMAFGASVRHSVRAERITGIGEATKASAAVTAQRSTSTERIVLVEDSRVSVVSTAITDGLPRLKTTKAGWACTGTFSRCLFPGTSNERERERETSQGNRGCLLEDSRQPCSATGRCPSPRVRA